MEKKRLPIPPFTLENALQKVQAAEDAWNTKDPDKVCMAYTIDTEWRNRTEFINGREEVKQFLKRKWEKELDYKLKKELWGFRETGWLSVLNTSGTTIPGNGLGVMATNSGNLMKMDIYKKDLQASTIYQFRKQNANWNNTFVV